MHCAYASSGQQNKDTRKRRIRSAARGWSETQHRLVKAAAELPLHLRRHHPTTEGLRNAMPRRQERVITKRTVDALSVEHRDAVFWDRDLPGFGIRVYPSGLKKYVVQSRGPGGSKRATLGRHGKLTADEARRRAAEAIDRIKRGEDPIPPPPEPEPTMAVLAERYMRDYVPSHCRASSAEVYRRALDNHILPALGGMRVGEVGREQVMELHYAMRGAPHAANAVLKIVAKMLSLAVEWGLREHGPNPCRAVRKYRTHPRERFLTDEEYCRLGRAVDELVAKRTVSRHAAARSGCWC